MHCASRTRRFLRLLELKKNAKSQDKSLSFCAANWNKVEQLFPVSEEFVDRHIGPRDADQIEMLNTLGLKVRFLLIFKS